MNIKELKQLGKAIVSGKTYTLTFNRNGETITEDLSKEAMNKTMREEIIKLVNSSPTSYQRYKLDMFDLIQESVDVKAPKDIENGLKVS